jgi:ribonuclease Z
MTHSHDDHSRDIFYMSKKEQMKLLVPVESVNFVRSYIKATHELNDCSEIRRPNDFELIGLKGGDTFEFTKFHVDVFQCIHSVPCIGYGFSEKRQKLKAEYKDLNGKQISELRKKGVVISEDCREKVFAFLGDTSIEIFDRNPELMRYKYVIVECTFLSGEEELQRAHRDGHVHWSQLRGVTMANPDVTFVLIHFSLRYSADEVRDFFRQLPSDETKNLVIFVGDYHRG